MILTNLQGRILFMKKFICILLTLLTIIPATALPSFAWLDSSVDTAAMVGDADGNGKIDAKDSALIKNSILGRYADINLAGADLNGDGLVNTKDSYCIKRSIVYGTNWAPGAGSTVERIMIGNTEIADFEISLPEDATENMKFAASELSEYINRARGVQLRVVTDSVAQHRIVINIDTAGELGDDGIDILVSDGCLYITGGKMRGAMYGVYEFLERYIGWVFINSENVCLNKNGSIVIADGTHYHYVPTMEFRDSMTYSYDGAHIDAATKLKISSWRGRGALERSAKYGYAVGFVGTAHTMADYCPDIDNSKQICYSDKDRYTEVLAAVLARIKQVLDKGDTCPSISVSPMDNTNYCTCKTCRLAYKAGKSYMTTQLAFVNKIAEGVAEVYPEIHVLTLAYWLARIPPRNGIVPNDNVDILYCWCGCNNHPYTAEKCSEDGDRYWYTNVYDKQYFEEWVRITKGKVYAWHYSTSYHFFLAQPDIIDNIRLDIKYMADFGINGIYCEGYYGTPDEHKDGNTFDMLTMYLLARCIWNPDMSEEEYNAYIEEFMYWYYGEGWQELVEYRKMCGEATEAYGKCWVNNGDISFDCISEEYYAENNDKIFELIDSALSKECTEAQYTNLVHLAAGAYWLCLCATYTDKYTNGTAEERALYEERYTRLYNWMIDYNIVDLDGKTAGFDRNKELDFNVDPYSWTGLDVKHAAKSKQPEYR